MLGNPTGIKEAGDSSQRPRKAKGLDWVNQRSNLTQQKKKNFEGKLFP